MPPKVSQAAVDEQAATNEQLETTVEQDAAAQATANEQAEETIEQPADEQAGTVIKPLPPVDEQVEVRVLSDVIINGYALKPGQPARIDAQQLTGLVDGGFVDPHPDAVSAALADFEIIDTTV